MNPLRATLEYLRGVRTPGTPAYAAASRRAASKGVLATPHAQARYVVVDTETTGLDPRHDRLIAIGAVGVAGGLIDFADCFECILRQEHASADANILIHGIGGETQLGGSDPRTAMQDFLRYLGATPLVAFRAEFDQAMLEHGVRSILGHAFRHPWIDLALLLPALFRDAGCASLDDWLEFFDLAGGARHRALADAWATAQLLQIVLDAAGRVRMGNAADLIAMQKAQRWLGRR